MDTSLLPDGFLSGPAPDLIRSDVDFVQGGLPEYKDSWAVVLDGVLTETECDMLIAGAEATTDGVWERAMINIGGGMQATYEDVRKCGRIILDDREIAAKLWARIEAAVPEIQELKAWPEVTGNGPAKRNETWKMTRLNERLRFLKYVGGEYFKGAFREFSIDVHFDKTRTLRRHIRDTRPQRAELFHSASVPE
jgi:hypothetical protein